MTRLENITYNNNPKIERLLFICGLHRSGTTLLERLLVSKFEISCLRADVPQSEGQHLQNVYSAALLFGGAGKFAFSTAMKQELAGLNDYKAHCRELKKCWSRFVVGDSSTLIEKYPPNVTKIQWLRRVFKGAKFIILLRDPRAVAAATQKWSKTSLPELMMHWNTAYSLAKKSFMSEDCIYVKYEDICSSTELVLDDIAQFVNIAPRIPPIEIDNRFQSIINTNEKYIQIHTCDDYGYGVWDDFGY